MAFKRPESVLVVIHTADEVLMLRRTEPPDFWQGVTGSLKWGESPCDAAVRELAEETGLGAEGLVDAGIERRFPILPAWRARYAPEVRENLEHRFYLPLPGRVPVTLDPREHSACEWLPFQAAARRAGSWTNREAIEAIEAQGA